MDDSFDRSTLGPNAFRSVWNPEPFQNPARVYVIKKSEDALSATDPLTESEAKAKLQELRFYDAKYQIFHL